MQLINQKILRLLPKQLTAGFVKVVITIGLFAYWGLIIVSTFLQFS